MVSRASINAHIEKFGRIVRFAFLNTGLLSHQLLRQVWDISYKICEFSAFFHMGNF